MLDTWKYLIDKADSPVKHTMTLTVTDSVGNKTTEVWTILVKFNEFPTIQAENRIFYLDEVKEGLLTYQELMSRATADDQEDGAAVNSSLKIVNYDEELYKNEGGGTYMVLYHVTDSMGKETYRSVSLMVFTKDNPTTDGDQDPDGKPGETIPQRKEYLKPSIKAILQSLLLIYIFTSSIIPCAWDLDVMRQVLWGAVSLIPPGNG